MKTIKNLLLLVIIIASMPSCATVFSGMKCKVKVRDGTPSGAKVFVNGNYAGTAPCNVRVSKNGLKEGQTKITIKSPGHEDQTVVLVRKLKAGALFGDCLLGFWPLLIDFPTGAIYKAYPGKLHYNLDTLILPVQPSVLTN